MISEVPLPLCTVTRSPGARGLYSRCSAGREKFMYSICQSEWNVPERGWNDTAYSSSGSQLSVSISNCVYATRAFQLNPSR